MGEILFRFSLIITKLPTSFRDKVDVCYEMNYLSGDIS